MKTKHIQKQLDFFVRDKAHHAYRKPAGFYALQIDTNIQNDCER